MAASKGSAVLDLEDDAQGLGMDLHFQDFGDTHTQPVGGVGGRPHEQTITFSDFPDTAEDDPESEKLMPGEGEEGGDEPVGLKAGASFWTFEFYQQFFDVESRQVGDRIIWSMVPKPGVSYLQSYIRPNPDLYGPFWICVTLAFTTAITGNLANYLATADEQSYVWRYEFRKVTLAASAIFFYSTLIPLAVWGLLAWRGSRAKISILELLCIYGYSLSIFVPVSILWMVPQPWFQWCLAIVAPVLSGSVLVRTIWPSLAHDSRRVALAIALFILLLHATLALGFMLYFFSAPPKAVSKVAVVEPNPPVASTEAPAPTPTKRKVPDEASQVLEHNLTKVIEKVRMKGQPAAPPADKAGTGDQQQGPSIKTRADDTNDSSNEQQPDNSNTKVNEQQDPAPDKHPAPKTPQGQVNTAAAPQDSTKEAEQAEKKEVPQKNKQDPAAKT